MEKLSGNSFLENLLAVTQKNVFGIGLQVQRKGSFGKGLFSEKSIF